MMKVFQAMMSIFRTPAPTPKAQIPPPVELSPERREIIEELGRAKVANARAGMGVVLTATRARRDESRVQYMMRGMLDELNKGRRHDV